MSKKVVLWMTVDLVIALLLTGAVIFLKNRLALCFDNTYIQLAIHIAGTVVWVIVDLTILFYFLLYWWSDNTWTRAKKKFRK